MTGSAAARRGRLPALVRAAALAAAALLGPCPAGSAAEGPFGACLRGVNLSGAEAGTVPGRPGSDYIYPTAAEIGRMASLGFTAVRLPVRWERLQPRLGAPLAAEEAGRLDAALDAAAASGLAAVLDLHNYAYYGPDRLGTPALPASALADVWGRLAARYGGSGRRGSVVFSLMNEPHDIPGPEWAADLPTGNNARDMLAVRDPLDRMAFDVHQYLDADFSGQSAECPAAARALAGLDEVHAWLVAHGRRGFLGEFGASAAPACLAALGAMADRVDADPKAWLGWTAWAAGPWWPRDYPFNLQPTADGGPPQLALLAARARAATRAAGSKPCRTIGPP